MLKGTNPQKNKKINKIKNKRFFGMNIYCFSYDFSVALISALALFEIRQFKTNCSGKKIDWGSHHGVQLFTE